MFRVFLDEFKLAVESFKLAELKALYDSLENPIKQVEMCDYWEVKTEPARGDMIEYARVCIRERIARIEKSDWITNNYIRIRKAVQKMEFEDAQRLYAELINEMPISIDIIRLLTNNDTYTLDQIRIGAEQLPQILNNHIRGSEIFRPWKK